METLQKSVFYNHHHRKQTKHKERQCQQSTAEVVRKRNGIVSSEQQRIVGNYQILNEKSIKNQEKTNFKQRKNKFTIDAEGLQKRDLIRNIFCHSQEHERVNRTNEESVRQTANQKPDNQKKQRLRTRIATTLLQESQEKSSKKTVISSPNIGRHSCSCNAYNLRFDSMICIMITMFVVATIVISGNTALAAQRDSLRAKDTTKGLSNNLNAIPNGGVDSISSGNAGNENGNAANSDGDNMDNIRNGNTVGIYDSSTASMNENLSSKKYNQTQAVASVTATTSTSNGATSKLSSSIGGGNTIASGSLQKANSPSSSSSSSNMPYGNTGINRNAIEAMDDTRSGPYFDKAASKNVTALLGKTAYLNCRVKNLGNKTMLLQVSWVRHRDIHLLTVGRYTYTSDQRFRAIHQPQTEDWILQIKYPQHRDSGIYECQVSTTPHMSHYIHLNVVEPSTEIIGAPDLYIESGSTINLTCVILNSPEPPAYIFWNHNNAIINYDSPRGGVSVVTNKGETTTSFLLIKTARPTDSGLYQCNPSNARPRSVTVHVLNGEFPAAMQRAGLMHHRMSPSHYLLVYLSLYLFTLAYVKRFMKLSQHSQPQPISSLNLKCDGSPPSAYQDECRKKSLQVVRCA